MISLHITVYDAGDGDQFTVHSHDDVADVMRDVTDQYSLVAMQTEDGQPAGFAIPKLMPVTGAEL